MKVVHSINNLTLEKNISETTSFILTNKIGGYCYFSDSPLTRYQGILFNDHFKMYKVIENIKLLNGSRTTELKNNFWNVERKKNEITESFFMPHLHNSLVYELDKEEEIEILLDVRESYLNPEKGRFYEITEENGKIIITYAQENEFKIYTVVGGYLEFQKILQWFKQYYELDRQRQSPPFERYVFSAIRVKSKQLIISFSLNKETALKENDLISKNLAELKDKQKRDIEKIVHKNKKIINKIKGREIKLAYISALNSLYNLSVIIHKETGLYAGLPWFFQFWSRDEAVSLRSLAPVENRETIKKIISRLTHAIENDKILNKYPNGNLYSADALGWLIQRISTIDKKLLINSGIQKIVKKLDTNFAINHKKETWMDSTDREGIRIELQALKLMMLKLKKSKKMEEELKVKVKNNFWNGSYLKDGILDNTLRPNAFIAAYFCPELLINEEWVKCFEIMIKHLWLEWGGFSTLDKKNPLFCLSHTGENPQSYHNGDSWFWINNLAAIVLYKIDKNRFKKYIEEIVKASKNEILWNGAIGHHAELSSASQLKSEGCIMQAWSAALFIELIETLHSQHKV